MLPRSSLFPVCIPGHRPWLFLLFRVALMNSNVCVIELLKFHWTASSALGSAYLPLYPSCAARFLRGVQANRFPPFEIATISHFSIYIYIYFNLWPSAVQFISLGSRAAAAAAAASANGVKTDLLQCWLSRARRRYPTLWLSAQSNRTAMQAGLELPQHSRNHKMKQFTEELLVQLGHKETHSIFDIGQGQENGELPP